MALDYRIYNATALVTLSDTTSYGVGYGASAGEPEPNSVFAKIWGGTFDPLVGVDYGNREIGMAIRIEGTSLDNWIANARQLERMLMESKRYWASRGKDGDAAYLSLQMNGMTYPIEFDIVDFTLPTGQSIGQFSMLSTTAPVARPIPLTLIVKPWGRPQAMVSSTSGTLNQGGGTGAASYAYTLTAPAGDVPCPARVTLSLAAGDNAIRVIMARRTKGNLSNFVHILQLETGAYTGYTVTNIETSGNFSLANAAVAAASAGNVLRLSHTAVGADVDAKIVRITINDNIADFYGRFLVVLRVDTTTLNVTDYSLTYGGAGADIVLASVTPIAADDHLFPLGIVTFPPRTAPEGAVVAELNMELRASMPATTTTLDLDCLYLIPIDEGYLDVTLSAASGTADQLVLDYLSTQPGVFLKDSAGDVQPELITPRAMQYFMIDPQQDNMFFVLFGDVSGSNYLNSDLTDQFTLKVEYFPLYRNFRVA